MRPQRIDELTKREHYYLRDSDVCYFFGEFSARNGRTFSETNELMVNLSVPVKYRNTPKWTRKDRAVQKIAQMFRAAFAPDRVGNITFVPLPPSHPRDHPEYDDRMSSVLRAMGTEIDMREMIDMMSTRETVDLSSLRMGPDALFTNMRVVPPLLEPVPEVIFLVADVLVTGANFVAAKRRIQELLPLVPVYGLFAARKLLETDEFDDPARFLP